MCFCNENIIVLYCLPTSHPILPQCPGNGTIDRDELKVVLQSCMEESAMQLSDEDLEDLTDALFDEADEDGSGAITFDELVGELDKFPGVMENLTMRSVSTSLNSVSCHDDDFVVTEACRYDNLRSNHWWQSRHHDNSSWCNESFVNKVYNPVFPYGFLPSTNLKPFLLTWLNFNPFINLYK